MLRIVKKNECLLVLDEFGHSFKLEKAKPCISVGKGCAEYKMDHGRFKFKERLSEKRLLYIKDFRQTGSLWEISLEDKHKELYLTASLSATEDRLDIRFEKVKTHDDINRMWIRIPAKKQEHVYGGGEIFSEFDLRGKEICVWVAEHTNAAAISRKILRERFFGKKPRHKEKFSSYETYYAQPTFISSNRYYFHSDATAFCKFDFTNEGYHELEIREISSMHFGFSPNFYALAENMSTLLGRQPELPDWVYDGTVLGIQGGTDVVKKKIETANTYNTKVAGVWCQDWQGRRITVFGKQLMWNWQWDSELYPDLDKEIWRLKEKGIRFMGYINPFLAVEKELYREASSLGYCVKNTRGEDYLVTITTFPAAMVDLTNPEAWQWLKEIIKRNMIDFGLDGWMADYGEYLPTDCVLFSGEDPEIVHCTWPARWARLNREALEETGKLGEIMFFTRAGHSDCVRYSTMMWNGDQHTDWSFDCGLASVIPASLSLAVCGFGLSHSDVGGYITFPPLKRSSELFIRWAEMSAFSPFMRSHEGNKPEANAQFDADQQVLRIHAKMSRVHYKLKPYLKALVKINAQKGIPVMRPLFYAYDEDKAYTESTEYLLGDDLLVAPILEESAVLRSVYLPNDKWVNIWNDKEYHGGEVKIDAPYGCPPVFYRYDSEYKELFKSIKES